MMEVENHDENVVDTSVIPKTVFDLHKKYRVELDTMTDMLKVTKDIETEEEYVLLLDIFISKIRLGLLNCNDLLQRILKKHPEIDINKIE